MSEEVKKKFVEFGKRLESEDEDIFKVFDEINSYMEGISDSATNPFEKSELSGMIIDLRLMRTMLYGIKAIAERFTKMQTDLNSAIERISELEKKNPLDDPDSLK